MKATPSFTSALRQLRYFVTYVARSFPSFYVILALTLLVLILEYVATSLLIPLSLGSGGQSSFAARAWVSIAASVGLTPSPRMWLWLFLLAMTARLLFGYVQNVATTYLGKRLHLRLGNDIFSQITQREPLTSVYTRSVGYYITLAGDDTFRCGTIIASTLQSAVGLFTTAVAMLVLYQFSLPLFTAVVVFLTLCALVISLFFRSVLSLGARSAELARELSTSFIEALNNVRSIRALGGERFVSASYATQLARYVLMLFHMEAIKSAIKVVPAILLLLIAAVLLRPGSSQLLPEASLFAGTIILVRIFASLGQFVAAASLLLTDLRAVGDIEQLVRRSDAAQIRAPVGRSSVGPVESVALQNVHFGYDKGGNVLHDLSVRFERSKSYAVMGPSGSGKSTLADVLLGLVAVDHGHLALNDVVVDGADLRTRFVLVEQHTRIFSTSLRENLLFGISASDEQLWDVLRLVDLEHTCRNMRQGLDTRLSYQGENFSGGQRQRIGIARALLRGPAVLVLDEATSALDAETRRLVMHNIRHAMRSGILILITHDPEVAQGSDRIFEFSRRDQQFMFTDVTAAAGAE